MKSTKFSPMLAARELPEVLNFPLLASFKIDGYRALVKDGVAYSRRLKPIPNPYVQKVLGRKKLNGFDGELTVGPPNAPNLIQRMGEIRREYGEPDFAFYVFDLWDDPGKFHVRHAHVGMLIEELKNERIIHLPHIPITCQEDLDSFEAGALAEGFEGIMLRDPNGPYKNGRSTELEGWLMKVKRWKDDEMRITGFEEEMENTNPAEKNELGRTKRSKKKEGMVPKGRLGAFLGADLKTGVDVRVGGGLTAKQREEYWRDRKKLKGEIVTYKHFEQTGVKDKRRHTIFRAFRDRADL